jgi:hypothetical protein
MEAKRRALDEIAARQSTADEKRSEVSRSLMVEAQFPRHAREHFHLIGPECKP